MKDHTYFRAYLAGIATPTVFLLVVMTVYTFLRYAYNFPVPVERVIVFPVAIVPNLWGLWNVSCTSHPVRGTRCPSAFTAQSNPFSSRHSASS